MRILSFNISHDSSVCCYNNGQIEFFCKEERISRTKRDDMPFRSLDLFFKYNSGKPIDKIIYLTPSNCQPEIENIFSIFVKKYGYDNIENYSSLTHHLCHASLSFYSSGFEKCLVFVVDRNGSILFDGANRAARESESIFMCDYENGLAPIYKSFWTYKNTTKEKVYNLLSKQYPYTQLKIHGACGIVKVYEAATTLIGQDPLENGKTMGLSSYGKETNKKLFEDDSPIETYFSSIGEDGEFEDSISIFSGYENLIQSNITERNYKLYADKAKHVQIETQQQVNNLIRKYVDITGIKNVCLVGGYALNVVANNFYIKSNPDINFYFEPIADDTGVPIGGAMLDYHVFSADKTVKSTKDNFFHYYEKEIIDGGINFSIENVVDLLIDQKSVAIFDGNPECGPRALGHRSILFDARNKNCKDIVNRIKKREWYRPFAGMILKEYFSEYFETLGLEESKYMTINFDCLPGIENIIPGIIHVDNTCRIQTIDKDNTFVYDLLTKFYQETNCPVILNTSFNLAGQPLVQTKQEALEVLHNSDLDAVYFVDQQKCFLKE